MKKNNISSSEFKKIILQVHIEAQIAYAIDLYDRGQFEESLKICNKLQSMEEKMQEKDIMMLYYARGNSNMPLGNFEQSVKDFTKVLEFAPGNAMVLKERGAASCFAGNIEDSYKDIFSAYLLTPEDLEVSEHLRIVTQIIFGELTIEEVRNEYLEDIKLMGENENSRQCVDGSDSGKIDNNYLTQEINCRIADSNESQDSTPNIADDDDAPNDQPYIDNESA